MSNMEWTQVFDYILPKSSNEKIIQKTLRVILGNGWVKKDNKRQKFVIPKIDLRVFTANNNIGVSFNKDEFNWFIRCLHDNVEHSIISDKKTLIFFKLPSGDVSISCTDNDKQFGIVLDRNQSQEVY